eukprot:8853704-Lingulodinium_polyedra.AAC.1
MAYSGEPGKELEYEITFLRGCKLLSAIGDRPITRKLILEVLGILNAQAFKSLSASYPVIERRVADPVEAGYPHATIYCEHRHLSVWR